MSAFGVPIPGRHPIAVGDEVVGYLTEVVAFVRQRPWDRVVMLEGNMNHLEFSAIAQTLTERYNRDPNAPAPDVYVRLGERLVKTELTLKNAGTFQANAPVVSTVELLPYEVSGDPNGLESLRTAVLNP